MATDIHGGNDDTVKIYMSDSTGTGGNEGRSGTRGINDEIDMILTGNVHKQYTSQKGTNVTLHLPFEDVVSSHVYLQTTISNNVIKVQFCNETS